MRIKRNLLLLFISAILITIPLGNRTFFFLAWLGLLPGIYVFQKDYNLKEMVLLGWIWGLLLSTGAAYWLFHPINDFSGLPLPGVVFLLFLLLAVSGLFTAGWALMYKLIPPRKEFSAVKFASTWVSFEFLRGLIFPYFPFGFLGLTQTGFESYLQLAEIGGIFFISFITAITAALLYKVLINRKWKAAILLLILIVSSYTFSVYLRSNAITNWEAEQEELLAGIVMTEVEQKEKWREENIKQNLEIVAERSDELFSEGAVLVITPETSLTFDYLHNDYYREEFLSKVNIRGKFMIGSQAAGDTPEEKFNSYFLLNEAGEEMDRYNKNDLIPGEVIPFSGVAEFFTGREWDSLTRGEEKSAFQMDFGGSQNIKARILTCSEILYASDDYKELDNIDLIINPSNEAWFGDTNLQSQMWESARMRAVELRTPILKSGNKAYGGYISPAGSEVMVDDYKNLSIQLGQAHAGKTFYQKYGDFAAYLSLLLSLIILPGVSALRN